ncbi:hypothetical protein PQE75_gp017 [Bacillus phage vB_BcoS-136]|uniref:Uncharacterized protein n=1 Tax=Bacillus phage vB_BcoS-136 TaxID=2419619 RepID=A0A3G3BV86_9CAUD|nr:hypothetical protein PQE75_gp017 [Bacillus phage vB_BcoS-136]AYP68149.1 hypothetical protein vBBcoS136_00017 [Bacillus phage vB_BcoS-136]
MGMYEDDKAHWEAKKNEVILRELNKIEEVANELNEGDIPKDDYHRIINSLNHIRYILR